MEKRILAPTNMVGCPINETHEVLRKNLVKHLLKCIEQNGGREIWTFCPYNMAHCVLRTNLLEHVLDCSDKVEAPLLLESNIKVVENGNMNHVEQEYWY